jgi:hypothetical protein
MREDFSLSVDKCISRPVFRFIKWDGLVATYDMFYLAAVAESIDD